MLGLFVSPAAADWTSHYKHVRTGFESRSWDNNTGDGDKTKIRLRNCYGWDKWEKGNPTLKVMKERSWRPEIDMGARFFRCSIKGTGPETARKRWGKLPGGDYHFTVKKINGHTSGQGLSASAKKVKVRY